MASKYNALSGIAYYGFPIFYRVECRSGHPTIILSYRKDGRIVYEHPPRRIKDIPFDSLPEELLEEFFQHLFSLELPAEQRERGLYLRRSLVDLPLAALLAADSYTLFYNPDLGRKRVSVEDDKRAIALLLQNEGETPWQEVTPARCSRWMYGHNLSDHARTSIKRVMRSLFLHQAEERIIDEIPWCNYDPNAASRPKQNFKSLIRTNVDPTTLTDGQCQALLTPIAKAIQRGTVSGLDIALLLRLILALSLEEICALSLGDFCFLRDFPGRLTVNITHQITRVDGQSSYRIRPLTDPYKIRKLPLSAYLHMAFESYKQNRKTKSAPLSELPLVPAKNNVQRHMRPDDLRKELEKRFALLLKQETTLKGRHPSLHELLNQTAPRELLKSGVEAEELRFLMGKAPKLVSAKSYADFLNESELNKLGALQDRWLGRLWPDQSEINADKSGKLSGKSSMLRYTSTQGERTQATIQITIPSVADPTILEALPYDGILLELGACYGCSGVITFSPIEQGDINDAKQ